jgi:hypothetical protein
VLWAFNRRDHDAALREGPEDFLPQFSLLAVGVTGLLLEVRGPD